MTQFETVVPADSLRETQAILNPDPRTHRAETLTERHQRIGLYQLNESVPYSVRVHFETGKNLYLYAWFVYRFYPVSEKQALATLEFALRERLTVWLNEKPRPDVKIPKGLKQLFTWAVNEKLISNEGLRVNRRWAEGRARERFSMEKTREMIDRGLDQIEYDDSEIEPISEDYSRDWMAILEESLPYIRNTYAHGSSMLHSSVLGTFEIVTDLVNQLYCKSKA